MKKRINAAIKRAYEVLLAEYGPQDWWPGDTPWEICTGAVLTQNTNWGNVEKAIALLKQAGALYPEKTLKMELPELELLIQPSGFFRIKALRLKETARWWLENVDGNDRPVWRNRALEAFRRDLLAVKGVGPETADSILLYCFDLPVFVIDAYTRRIAARHLGIAAAGTMEYHHLQRLFTEALPEDVRLYNEYHALLVRAAKNHCRKASCLAGCPLKKVF